LMQQRGRGLSISSHGSPCPSPASRKKFDPRGEILSLTSSLRSPQSANTSPSAPNNHKAYSLSLPPSGGSGAVLGNSSSHSGAGLGLSNHNGALNGVFASSNYVVGNSIGSYNNNNSVGSRNRVSWSPVTNFNDPSAAVLSWGAGGNGPGGEAMYLAQKRHKSESVRRKHMRQHSAQLYMEDIKGVEQTPQCRDVIFLLLFVFHLLFIVYLGNMYSNEAFRAHTVQEEEEDSAVTIYYTPLLYLSCISGAFGVAVSTILLGIMSIFPKHFVQVALVVVITLSFVWGTIGIGLSPRNFVPVTGIIALALSVAYAFIVWDRIPFAAANLASALSAIRSHPSIVALAVFVQMITVGWSVYFCIVVVGIYDSIRLGKLQVSHQMTVAIYVMFGASLYWTFQVLVVRAVDILVIRFVLSNFDACFMGIRLSSNACLCYLPSEHRSDDHCRCDWQMVAHSECSKRGSRLGFPYDLLLDGLDLLRQPCCWTGSIDSPSSCPSSTGVR
jgi:Plasma-membrane choline transporter